MSTVFETIRRLLPDGSRNANGSPSWSGCPSWPPDAFAVAATLVESSACYAHDRVGADDPKGYVERVADAAEEWRAGWDQVRTDAERKEPGVPAEVQRCWDILMRHSAELVSVSQPKIGTDAKNPPWWDAAMWLLAIADEACVEVGFHLRTESRSSFIAELVFAARSDRVPNIEERGLLISAQSICRRVPVYEACVQPKSRTAQVGRTLRSLSHHLALLPPSGEARAEWWISPLANQSSQLNLLLVPFPYRLPSGAFQAVKSDRTGNYFALSPKTWLPGSATEVTAFLVELIKAASGESGTVHGVVLPELALDKETARAVASALRNDFRDTLELFICGVSDAGSNAAYTAIFGRNLELPLWDFSQRKHHSWRLDKGQICNYGLAHVLDPARHWWEDTALGEREIKSLVFRDGASLNVLVCEDLARLDPAQVFLRAMGPNLIVALLLDGPQATYRWPGHCGTVLAEDPGSSVLTLSCLGMVRRHREAAVERDSRTEQPPEWQVALWKEASERPRELKLKSNSHAILVTLSFRDEEERTFDRRSDHGTSVHVSLAQSRQVAHPQPPSWLRWPSK